MFYSICWYLPVIIFLSPATRRQQKRSPWLWGSNTYASGSAEHCQLQSSASRQSSGKSKTFLELHSSLMSYTNHISYFLCFQCFEITRWPIDLFLVVYLLDFVWNYGERCYTAGAWLCLLSSWKDGCVKCERFHSCAHSGLDDSEIYENFSFHWQGTPALFLILLLCNSDMIGAYVEDER